MTPKKGSPEWCQLHFSSIQEFLLSQGFLPFQEDQEFRKLLGDGTRSHWAIHFQELPGKTVLEFARRGQRDGWLTSPQSAPPFLPGFIL